MCGGSRRLHQTKSIPFRNFILTKHRTKPKKSRGNEWKREEHPKSGRLLTSPETCFRATTLLKQNVFTQSLNALLCSPCGFVSPKQLVVQSQYHLAGKRYGCLYRFIYHCAPIYIIYIAQQGCSTSIHSDTPPFLEQCQKTEQRKNKRTGL